MIGAGGGAGITAVAAQFAAGSVAQRQHAIAFDFSPDNALRLHFGMVWDDETGLAFHATLRMPGPRGGVPLRMAAP